MHNQNNKQTKTKRSNLLTGSLSHLWRNRFTEISWAKRLLRNFTGAPWTCDRVQNQSTMDGNVSDGPLNLNHAMYPIHSMYGIYASIDPPGTIPTDRQSYGSPRKVVFGYRLLTGFRSLEKGRSDLQRHRVLWQSH